MIFKTVQVLLLTHFIAFIPMQKGALKKEEILRKMNTTFSGQLLNIQTKKWIVQQAVILELQQIKELNIR